MIMVTYLMHYLQLVGRELNHKREDSPPSYTTAARKEDIVGNLRDNIRRAMREAKSLSKWSSDTQKNLYSLDSFLRKSGYRLADILDHEEGSRELIIEPVKPGYLHPEIVHDVSEGSFYIKVEEHGLLNASDVEEIIKGYTTALGVVGHLDSLDIQSLETTEE